MITNTKMHSSYSNDDKYKSVNDRVCTDCNIYGIFWVKVSQVLLCESVLSACFNPITLRILLVLLLNTCIYICMKTSTFPKTVIPLEGSRCSS